MAKKDKKGKLLTEDSNISARCVNLEYVMKNNLTPQSGPEQCTDLLMPLGRNIMNGKECFSFSLLRNWINLKVSLGGTRVEGDCYPECALFTTKEICQHFSICVLQGCNSFPQVKMKIVLW